MAYRVNLTAKAEADAYAAYEHIREVAPRSAEKWLIGLFALIQTLDEMPSRCALIPEAEEVGHPARQLLYGKRSGTYRIIFDIQEQSEEGPRIRVLRIRHGARAPITAEDIEAEE
jgi:plasmid stabilization system protein ParE